MKNMTIIDAGPLIALFDGSDNYHVKVKSFLENSKSRLITSWPVITEVTHLLDFNINAQTDFLKWIYRGAIGIFDLRIEHVGRIVELMEKYSDLPMDLADASLVIITEVMDIKKIVSLDTDFSVYKIRGINYFENLLSV